MKCAQMKKLNTVLQNKISKSINSDDDDDDSGSSSSPGTNSNSDSNSSNRDEEKKKDNSSDSEENEGKKKKGKGTKRKTGKRGTKGKNEEDEKEKSKNKKSIETNEYKKLKLEHENNLKITNTLKMQIGDLNNEIERYTNKMKSLKKKLKRSEENNQNNKKLRKIEKENKNLHLLIHKLTALNEHLNSKFSSDNIEIKEIRSFRINEIQNIVLQTEGAVVRDWDPKKKIFKKRKGKTLKKLIILVSRWFLVYPINRKNPVTKFDIGKSQMQLVYNDKLSKSNGYFIIQSEQEKLRYSLDDTSLLNVFYEKFREIQDVVKKMDLDK
ncbi:peptidyl-prolyl cis-trans isomerase cyp63 [Anaeramoeba flamelloides]|uniref:Peptidyl-prolyl cis-trans isomerase cyp63 n=1 Tax=Anaeramoeba flamelloides TaxID=1746091 RepID=A0AAV7YAD6_9EUKA|nr:peptidyl-prolyl cis-trans isomerase cyp63 [Anaeramoeba flamelloides]